MNPSRRAVLPLSLITALALTACEVRREPAPESTRQLRVAAVHRIVEQPALSPASWSPDGSRFAFGDETGVYVVPAEGSPRRIGPAAVATTVSWSRPLDLLAVVDRGAVWILRPDGSRRHRIDLPGFATAAVWSPGGDRLATILRRGSAGAPAFELWLASPNAQFRRLVVRAPAGMAMRELQWFPNGLYLFYGLSRLDDDVVTEAWKVRVTYPDRQRLPLAGPALQVRLAPTGRAIAYVTGDAIEDGKGRVVVSKVDGKGRFTVTERPGRYSGLAWSPQGDKLAFAEVTDQAHAEIWIADGDASGRLSVHSYALEFSDPSISLSMAWSPDGRRLLFGTNSGTFQGPIWMAVFERQ